MKRRNVHLGGTQLPLIEPESSWLPISELPDLRGKITTLALDRETRDDGLAIGRGPGWAHKAGHICGTSIAWREGDQVKSFYAPLKHPESVCIDRNVWIQWEKDHAAAGICFVMHNAPYDIGFGAADLGIGPPALIEDTTAMAVMLDENRQPTPQGDTPYSLEAVSQWRGIPGKDETLLKEAGAAFGFQGKGNLWRLPARFVGPYAEADAQATLLCYESMLPDLEADGLMEAYRLEMDLVPLVHEMRRRGIRIDTDVALRTQADLIAKRDDVLRDMGDKLSLTLGMEDMRSARRLAKFFDSEKVSYPETPKSKEGSFADWMEDHPHWLPQGVAKARQLDDAANKFIGEYIISYSHKGRLHANINQFRSDDGGTRSHRFSYSDPPLQQMHGDKHPDLRDIIRGVFFPEPGQWWCKLDLSQQEVKLIVHFAALLKCDRADEALQRFITNPLTDYHSLVAEMTGLDRYWAKQVNFAKAYGAGLRKFAAMTGMEEYKAAETMAQYDREMPFVKQLEEKCKTTATSRGYIRLIDGARCRFDTWEPSWREQGEKYSQPLRKDMAEQQWPNRRLRRAFTHKAMNRLIQGSGARQVKKAMRDCWREGLVPLLQLHDDLNFSFSSEEEGRRAARIMVESHKFLLPFTADMKWGGDWGGARFKWEDMNKEG